MAKTAVPPKHPEPAKKPVKDFDDDDFGGDDMDDDLEDSSDDGGY